MAETDPGPHAPVQVSGPMKCYQLTCRLRRQYRAGESRKLGRELKGIPPRRGVKVLYHVVSWDQANYTAPAFCYPATQRHNREPTLGAQ